MYKLLILAFDSSRFSYHGHELPGFPQRLENLETESGQGKVMEHEKLAQGHGILSTFMECYQFCPEPFQI